MFECTQISKVHWNVQQIKVRLNVQQRIKANSVLEYQIESQYVKQIDGWGLLQD